MLAVEIVTDLPDPDGQLGSEFSPIVRMYGTTHREIGLRNVPTILKIWRSGTRCYRFAILIS
jgi:hypothetical protein